MCLCKKWRTKTKIALINRTCTANAMEAGVSTDEINPVDDLIPLSAERETKRES
jgi:hypothetical protein